MSERIDPRTPILVGAGQASDPLDSPDHRGWSAADLGGEAARRALDDAALPATSVDTVVGIRQFETSTPWSPAPLGRSDNYPRSVAARIGADPRRAVLEVVGGQAPQHLVNEFARAIAAGEATTVLLVGGEAISTARAWAGRPDAPDFSESVGGRLEDRGHQIEGLITGYEASAGLITASSQYSLLENARRARLDLSRRQYANQLGRLFAPFTSVAAKNPHAAAPVERSAAELMTVTDRNRLIADPYPRFMVSRDQVNQGAAVLLTSAGVAQAAGIARDRWVFLHGYADLAERPLLERPDLSVGPASQVAARTAIERAGVTVDRIDAFDLYSCFPIPVLNICEALGLAHDDPRGLTLTGGLPFFGGPGNNYSMHAIAEAIAAVRARPGARAFVGANGGLMSKYSAGVYSTEPRPFETWSDADAQAELDAVPGPALAEEHAGPAGIETYTVVVDRHGARTGIVVARTPGGARTLAVSAPGDADAVALLMSERPFGAPITVTAPEQPGSAGTFRR